MRSGEERYPPGDALVVPSQKKRKYDVIKRMRRAHARQHKAKGMYIAGWLAAQLKTQTQTQTVGASLEYNAPNLSYSTHY